MNKQVLRSMVLAALALTVTIGCKRKQEEIPEPDPVENTIEILINDFDGNGVLPGLWSSTGDASELSDYRLAKDPDPAQPDSVLYMTGKDSDADWWIGTALGGDSKGTALGLPKDASKVKIQFDLYVANTTSNMEIQLQEADGDVFSWNLGSDGGHQPTAGEWATYQTSSLDKFLLAGWNNGADGDKTLATDLLANVSLALISGTATGNTSIIYIDNVKFIVVEVGDVASPTNLSARAISKSQINLTWTDNSSGETGFVIERAQGNGILAAIDTVAADVTTFSDRDLTSATAYSYRVYALMGNKVSNYSNVATATTQANVVTSQLVTTFDGDGNGLLPGAWAKTSDSLELTDYAIILNPMGTGTTDSVLYMKGTDSDVDWWIGTGLGGDNKNGTKFGLPADLSKISVSFELYAGNATTNIDLQLQEADGDVFTWNFGGDGGYQASQTEWVTYTVPLSAFKLSDWGKAGDNVFAPELLSNISIALISGSAQGNEAIAYINNVKFLISE